MRSRLLVPAVALPLALLCAGCSSLTKPEEIRIVADTVMPTVGNDPAGARVPGAPTRPLPPTPGGG